MSTQQQHRRFRSLYSLVFVSEEPSPPFLHSPLKWQEALSLPVDASWLSGAVEAWVRLKRKPDVVHLLVGKLVAAVGDDNISERRHALEALGVVLEGLFSKRAIDFNNDVFRLLCSFSDAGRFCRLLISNATKRISPPCRQDDIKYETRLAVALLLAVATASENLQQNSILTCLEDHDIWQAMTRAFESVYVIQEEALTLTALLCNHHKHENKNPFVTRLRAAGVQEVHSCLYALEQMLVYSLEGLVKETTRSSGDTMLSWASDAASSLMAESIGITALLGNWMIGSPTPAAKPRDLRRRRSSTGIIEGSLLVPLVRPERELSMPKWIRARIALLCTYELLCHSNEWMEESLLHEVPPWYATSGRSVPLECPTLFLRTLSLLSFFVHCSNTAATLLSLNVLRCLVETPNVCSLLFCTSIENKKTMIAMSSIFRRTSNGDLLHAKSKQHILAPVLYSQMSALMESSKSGTECSKAVDVVKRMLAYECRLNDFCSADWEQLWNALFTVADCICKGELSGLNPVQTLELQEKLLQVLNMLLLMKHMLFYFEIVNRRSLLDDFRKSLERNTSMGDKGLRLAKTEMANLRTIVFHFSSVIALSDPEGGNKVKPTVLQAIAEHAKTLQLKPHNRIGDGFAVYVESKQEIAVVRSFIKSLISDMKMHRKFARLVA